MKTYCRLTAGLRGLYSSEGSSRSMSSSASKVSRAARPLAPRSYGRHETETFQRAESKPTGRPCVTRESLGHPRCRCLQDSEKLVLMAVCLMRRSFLCLQPLCGPCAPAPQRRDSGAAAPTAQSKAKDLSASVPDPLRWLSFQCSLKTTENGAPTQRRKTEKRGEPTHVTVFGAL